MATHTQHKDRGDTMRARVVVPQELLREVDALVGRSRRSEFFAEAVREKLARERLRHLVHEMAGSLREPSIPEWETPETTSAWVRALRAESDE